MSDRYIPAERQGNCHLATICAGAASICARMAVKPFTFSHDERKNIELAMAFFVQAERGRSFLANWQEELGQQEESNNIASFNLFQELSGQAIGLTISRMEKLLTKLLTGGCVRSRLLTWGIEFFDKMADSVKRETFNREAIQSIFEDEDNSVFCLGLVGVNTSTFCFWQI